MDTEHLTGTIKVHMPISDFVVGDKPDMGQYHYKLTVVRNGVPVTDAQWRTDRKTKLPILIAGVPNQ
jgi:hypothetical protein